MKPGALFLLLAVAATQVDLFYASEHHAEEDISLCPITLFGRENTFVHVVFNNDSSASLCFNNNQSDPQDCLLWGDTRGAKAVEVMAKLNSTGPGSRIHRHLTNINSTSPCHLEFRFFSPENTTIGSVFIYNFGPQTAVDVSMTSNYTAANTTLDILANGTSLGPWSFTNQEFNNLIYDISGCRILGVSVLAGSKNGVRTRTCSTLMCDASANITSVKECGRTEVCQDYKCVPRVVCTITGSTVIDFHGRVQSVPDRCAYNLIKYPRAFHLSAVFRERRRKDVVFMDSLMIDLANGSHIHLYQDGRVAFDRRPMEINAVPQVVHDVELTKDHTGVTAKMLSSDMTIFFDGNTAHVSGLAAPLAGLCGNPLNSSQTTILMVEKAFRGSEPGCEIQHNDTMDPMINCNRSIKHCGLMRQAPFTACHRFVDPEPYITACTDTLCHYPALDGVSCQFFAAYDKACYLISHMPLKDWRPPTDCPPPRGAFCSEYCGHHEYCDGSRCHCRAFFATKYKQRNAFGDPSVCSHDSATLTLARCLLEDKFIDYKTLHLNDPSCKGVMDPKTHMVTFSFDTSHACGTEVMLNNSQIIYSNSIEMDNGSSSVITRQDQFQIDFSCIYKKPEVRSVSFTIQDSSVVQQVVSGIWNYTLMMDIYTDRGLNHLVRPSTKLSLNQKVWMELKTEGLNADVLSIVTDSCWATNKASPDDKLRYDLIIDGCPNPADDTVDIQGNGLGLDNVVSFNVFQFSGKITEIYMHCKLELCPTQSNSCAPSCGGGMMRRRRRRRSIDADVNPALISMAWTK